MSGSRCKTFQTCGRHPGGRNVGDLPHASSFITAKGNNFPKCIETYVTYCTVSKLLSHTVMSPLVSQNFYDILYFGVSLLLAHVVSLLSFEAPILYPLYAYMLCYAMAMLWSPFSSCNRPLHWSKCTYLVPTPLDKQFQELILYLAVYINSSRNWRCTFPQCSESSPQWMGINTAAVAVGFSQWNKALADSQKEKWSTGISLSG
jgi:hypothetical protein